MAIGLDDIRLGEALASRFVELTRYREVVDIVPVPTLLADETGLVTHVNRAYCNLFQVTRPEVLGYGWKAVIRPEDLPRIELVWDRVIKTGAEEWSSSADFRVGDMGGFIPCSFKVSKIKAASGFVSFIFPSCGHPVNCPIHSNLVPTLPVSRS